MRTFGSIQLSAIAPSIFAEYMPAAFPSVEPFADFRFVSLDDCPAVFCVAFPRKNATGESWRTEWGLAGGRGLDHRTALAGCVGELAERMSLLSRGDTDPLVVSAEEASLPANAFLKFSNRQESGLAARHERIRDAWTKEGIEWHRLSPRAVEVVDMETAQSETVPSVCVLLNEERYFGVQGEQIGTSCGTAAHPDRDMAQLNALLELAEHDAVGIWWFNKLERPSIPLEGLRSGGADDLFLWLSERHRQTFVLRLATDLPVYPVAAVSFDQSGRWLAYGFCARLALTDAMIGAVLEMLQCEISLSAMSRRASTEASAESDVPALLRWSAGSDIERIFGSGRAPEPDAQYNEMTYPADRFVRGMRGMGTYIADITREDIGVPVLRVISRQLCDWMPRFAKGRLYNLPVELGLRNYALVEEKLNEDRIVV